MVLPELFLSFYLSKEQVSKYTSKDIHFFKQKIIQISEKFQCHIVCGYPEAENNQKYNSALVTGTQNDIIYNHRKGVDMLEIYGGLIDSYKNSLSDKIIGYGNLNNLESLQYISETYADGIGVWKNSILPRTSIDKNSKISTKLTGEITSFVENAHQAGLLVHCYTLRPEEEYLTLNTDEKVQTMREEIEQLMKIGVDGFFCDDPATCLQQVTINY